MSVIEALVHILPSLHLPACFDWATATRHAAIPYMVGMCHPSLCSRPVRLKGKGGKNGGHLQVVFLPWPFKSTLRRAPLWPLMLPVHLAKRSGETQDHRNGQKQFHPLSEPISTKHSEDENRNCICYAPSKTLVKHFK